MRVYGGLNDKCIVEPKLISEIFLQELLICKNGEDKIVKFSFTWESGMPTSEMTCNFDKRHTLAWMFAMWTTNMHEIYITFIKMLYDHALILYLVELGVPH